MEPQDAYEKLRINLHANPAGAPPSKALDEILRILFTPEEIEVAACLTFVPKPVSHIAEKAGLNPETTLTLCESMADKGIIFSRKKNGTYGYSLVPIIPGIFEFPFMTGQKSAMHLKLGKLWEEYHYESQGAEFGSSPTPLTRVLPVEESLKEQSEVLPFEILSEKIAQNKTFALAECACRISLDDRACNKATDVCLIFDKGAEFLIERKLAKQITLDQALDVLKRSEKEGLVHMTNNSQDRISLVCNCCACCCTLLTGMTKIKSPYPFAKGRFVATVDDALCSGCGICSEQRCVVEAISITEDIAVVNPEGCIGCGLCVSECPETAIHMALRENPVIPPATVTDMGAAVLIEKNRLDDFMALNSN